MKLWLITCFIAFTCTHNTHSEPTGDPKPSSEWLGKWDDIEKSDEDLHKRVPRGVDSDVFQGRRRLPFYNDADLLSRILSRKHHQGQGRPFPNEKHRKQLGERPIFNDDEKAKSTVGPNTFVPAEAKRKSKCEENCFTTQEYNPVCGNNMITYSNVNRLFCARRCGILVRAVFMGTCQPL